MRLGIAQDIRHSVDHLQQDVDDLLRIGVIGDADGNFTTRYLVAVGPVAERCVDQFGIGHDDRLAPESLDLGRTHRKSA